MKLITDGAYSSSRDQGGLAFVIIDNDKIIKQYSTMIPHTTNNKMELGAIILGLCSIKGPIDSLEIITDSEYCIGGATGNKRNKNIKLWERFDKEFNRVKKLCPIKFTHVKGHSGEKWNEYCDKLAVEASQLYEIKKK